ncbi:MAG: elongation factor P [Fidelibacterota bacterium]
MATTADFRNGMTIIFKGDIYRIIEFLHVKPGKGGAFVRTKLKNIKTGQVIDNTFRAGERIVEARIEGRDMKFLYSSGDIFYFMDLKTYEQMEIPKEYIEEQLKFLKEDMDVKILFYESRPIDLELPIFVHLKVNKTDPGVRGNTAAGGTKPATLETGMVINVPLFIEEGDVLKIDTRTGNYVERVK